MNDRVSYHYKARITGARLLPTVSNGGSLPGSITSTRSQIDSATCALQAWNSYDEIRRTAWVPTPRIPATDVAAQVVAETRANGGCTFSLYAGPIKKPCHQAHAVGLAIPKPRYFPTTLSDKALAEAVVQFLATVECFLLDPRVCVGTWTENGLVEVSLTAVVRNRQRAERLARKHGQRFIFALHDGNTIRIDPSPTDASFPQRSAELVRAAVIQLGYPKV